MTALLEPRSSDSAHRLLRFAESWNRILGVLGAFVSGELKGGRVAGEKD